MKKVLFLLSLVLLFLSCKGEKGERGEKGDSGSLNRAIFDLQAEQNNWAYSNADNNNYFYATFDMPELTANIYDNGIITVYREYDTGKSNAAQTVLPYVRHKEYQVNDSTWGFYTETVDYEYTVGKLNIFYTASDFDYELDETFVPEAMHFRVVFAW